MIVGGVSNLRYFWYKHLFCVLFVRSTYVRVNGSSTLLASGVVLVPVMFPVYTTLQYLYPSYWSPKDRTKNLSLITLKLYICFIGASHEALSTCTLRNFQGHTLSVKTNSKKYWLHQTPGFQEGSISPYSFKKPSLPIHHENYPLPQFSNSSTNNLDVLPIRVFSKYQNVGYK